MFFESYETSSYCRLHLTTLVAWDFGDWLLYLPNSNISILFCMLLRLWVSEGYTSCFGFLFFLWLKWAGQLTGM